MKEVILDTIVDSLKLIPFLLVAFLIIELLEHKLNNKTKSIITKSKKIGPIIGSLLGVIPQCGFSVMATNLYITRIITLGTLISIYLSTSDEMLIIMISEKVEISLILKILLIKIFLVFILIIDLIFNINNTIYDLYKLIFIIIYSSALTYTTSTSEITYGIERMLRPFNNYIPVNDIAMIITLTIRYIPTLTMEADRIIKAQKMRGINFDNKNIKDKISTLVGVFIPMFVLSLKKSESLGDIMDLRLYNYGKSRTNLRTNKWKKKDSLLLVLNILILSIVIFY